MVVTKTESEKGHKKVHQGGEYGAQIEKETNGEGKRKRFAMGAKKKKINCGGRMRRKEGEEK